VLQQQNPRRGHVGRGSELEHHAEVIGQLVVGQDHARLAVCRLEPQQRHSSVAGVAVLEVRQVEAASLLVVERRHEVCGQLRQGSDLEMRQEGHQRIRPKAVMTDSCTAIWIPPPGT